MSRKVCGSAMKLLRTSAWIFVFVIFASSSLLAQTPPGWKTYVNRVHGFSIAYPPTYERVHPLHKNLFGEDMDKAAAEGRWVELMHQGDTIDILLMKERFDLDSFVTQYAPTGVEYPPRAEKEGNNTFYGYGAGHQGFPQPDQFFFNLRGKTLYIRVDGPFTDYTTTTDETKKIERQMLTSFRTFPPTGSR
jgi:hypothetical protein